MAVVKGKGRTGDLRGVMGKKTPRNTENEMRCRENLGGGEGLGWVLDSLGSKC